MDDTFALLAEYNRDPTVTLRNRIALLNGGLVGKIAKRFARVCGEPYEDLYQIGMTGLLRAIPKFKLGKGFAFSSFVVPYIRGDIQHYLRDSADLIKAPRALSELYGKGAKLGLDNAGTAQVLGISLDEWLEAKASCSRVLSLNKRIDLGHDGRTTELQDLVAAPMLPDHDLIEHVYEALAKLRQDEHDAVVACLINDQTRKAHGADKNILPVTAGRRVASGIGGLRQLLEVC